MFILIGEKTIEALTLVSKNRENTASKETYVSPWILEPESLVKVRNV